MFPKYDLGRGENLHAVDLRHRGLLRRRRPTDELELLDRPSQGRVQILLHHQRFTTRPPEFPASSHMMKCNQLFIEYGHRGDRYSVEVETTLKLV